jgi:hypothetical protein
LVTEACPETISVESLMAGGITLACLKTAKLSLEGMRHGFYTAMSARRL